MEISLSQSEIFTKNCPAQVIAVEWLNDRDEVLATAVAKHNYQFLGYDYDNDREHSHFLEDVSNLENEVLFEVKKVYPDIYAQTKISGRMLITNHAGEVVYFYGG